MVGAQALIKRVIAVGGDAVQIKDGSLFVNGQEQFEDYTFEVRMAGAPDDVVVCHCRVFAPPVAPHSIPTS